MARVAPLAASSLSTLSLSDDSVIDPINSNNNNNENEEVWKVNLKNVYTKANAPRLVRLNALKRMKDRGNEIAIKAIANEEKHALSMFNKKSRRRRSARRVTQRRR